MGRDWRLKGREGIFPLIEETKGTTESSLVEAEWKKQNTHTREEPPTDNKTKSVKDRNWAAKEEAERLFVHWRVISSKSPETMHLKLGTHVSGPEVCNNFIVCSGEGNLSSTVCETVASWRCVDRGLSPPHVWSVRLGELAYFFSAGTGPAESGQISAASLTSSPHGLL